MQLKLSQVTVPVINCGKFFNYGSLRDSTRPGVYFFLIYLSQHQLWHGAKCVRARPCTHRTMTCPFLRNGQTERMSA